MYCEKAPPVAFPFAVFEMMPKKGTSIKVNYKINQEIETNLKNVKLKKQIQPV